MSDPQSRCRSGAPFPLVESLPADFCLLDAFQRLAGRAGCLWLDSASSGPVDRDGTALGRYSFLTCDPIQQLVASPGDADPWPALEQLCGSITSDFDVDLPPFQGGVAGLIGYEAAQWLEPVGRAAMDDLPTPAISVGLYDWTIAVDHSSGRAWIIAQGWSGPEHPNDHDKADQGWGDDRTASQRMAAARDRIATVKALLAAPPISHTTASQSTSIFQSTSGITEQSGAVAGNPDCGSDRDTGSVYEFATQHPGVVSNFSRQGFCDAVADVVQRICEGDSFQVNLAQRLLCRADRPSEELYRSLRQSNPAPFGAYYNGGDFQVLSSSPEGFLKVRGPVVQTRPIKGTVRRTGHDDVDLKLAQKLVASEKDRAENVMIVDLMRNDLSRVCEDDSVVVRQLCQVERYEFVQHLVSVVEGRLLPGVSMVDLLMASFPGGSVTGAPKIEAMRTIAELEKHPRGAYCGSIGYIGAGHQADFNILIRTITSAHGRWQIPVGGGITARSVPETEEYETWSKAEGMLRAVLARDRSLPQS